MLDRIYELPLSQSYVRHWGVVEGVRELFQNALDSDSPFEYQLGPDSLRITSRFSRLEPKTLLLGTTSKADARDKIGSFGEGYKIALLVLTRAGVNVRVENNDRLWVPSFKRSRQFEDEVLCIRDSSYPEGRGQGLTFSLEGLDESDLDAIRETNMHMWAHVGEVLTTSRGEILLEHPGKLFVNGLFVCKTQLKYGYNMKPEYLRLERDRQTVSTFDLAFQAKDMWFETGRHEQIAAMIEENAPDMEYANYGTPELVRQACYELFKKNNPGAVVASSPQELKQMIAQGMTKVVYINKVFGDCVRTSSDYLTQDAVFLRTPQQVLHDWFNKNRKHMRRDGITAFQELLDQSKEWSLK